VTVTRRAIPSGKLEDGKSDPLGLVKIVRKRGRIAGYSHPPVPTDILWCGTNRPRKKFGQRKDGFSFPPAVREFFLQQTQGHTVLHLFGGKADFGYRLDIDPMVKPDVVGSVWEAEKFFQRNQFEDVILDPPYMQYRQQEKRALLIRAAWIASRYVWWFGTTKIATDSSLKLQKIWYCDCGVQCAVRLIQQFAVAPRKRKPSENDLQRGEGLALKYRNWRTDSSIPLFDELPQLAPAPCLPASQTAIASIWEIGNNDPKRERVFKPHCQPLVRETEAHLYACGQR
jgi:hypothetical protein